MEAFSREAVTPLLADVQRGTAGIVVVLMSAPVSK
jgi:hypothetical protein